MSRAECLISIVDILNGSLDSLRGKLKQVGRLLAHEGDLSQWRCRIVLGDDPMLLPPVGKKLGNHFPMEVEGQKVGTLIVTTPHLEFDEVDKPFFDTLARLLGIFVYRENMWIEFHSEIDRVQASLLLNLATTPDSLASADHPTVEHMLRMLGHLKGKVEFPLVNKL